MTKHNLELHAHEKRRCNMYRNERKSSTLKDDTPTKRKTRAYRLSDILSMLNDSDPSGNSARVLQAKVLNCMSKGAHCHIKVHHARPTEHNSVTDDAVTIDRRVRVHTPHKQRRSREARAMCEDNRIPEHISRHKSEHVERDGDGGNNTRRTQAEHREEHLRRSFLDGHSLSADAPDK